MAINHYYINHFNHKLMKTKIHYFRIVIALILGFLMAWLLLSETEVGDYVGIAYQLIGVFSLLGLCIILRNHSNLFEFYEKIDNN